MGTFAVLKTRIADELNRTDLTTQISAEVLSAVSNYAPQRFWFNEQSDTAVTVANQANLAVPGTSAGEVVEILRLDLTANGFKIPLCRVDWDALRDMGGNDSGVPSGQPAYFAYFADQFWFYPTPGGAYTLTLSYVKRLTELSADGDTNAWTTEGEELIRARAKASIEIRYLRDDFARQEYLLFAGRGEPYLCGQEKAAHLALLRLSRLRRSTGLLSMPDGLGGSDRYNILRG